MDEIVLESLAEGSTGAKEQLNRIQEIASGLEDDSLVYLTFFFYLTKRLQLAGNALEEQFKDKQATELKEFVEKKAKKDHMEL